jgi:hypothetical protein
MQNYHDHYLAVGPYNNWKVAFSNGCVWGLPKNRVSTWHSLNSGDIAFFYVESPISAVNGYGNIVDTLYDESPFFADDYGNKSLWPYRFKFDVLWPKLDPLHEKRISIAGLPGGITLHRGFQNLGTVKGWEMIRRCL